MNPMMKYIIAPIAATTITARNMNPNIAQNIIVGIYGLEKVDVCIQAEYPYYDNAPENYTHGNALVQSLFTGDLGIHFRGEVLHIRIGEDLFICL